MVKNLTRSGRKFLIDIPNRVILTDLTQLKCLLTLL